MKRILLSLAVVAVVAGAIYLTMPSDTSDPARAAVEAAPAGAELATVTLAVSGMTCSTCPITVRQALRKVPGVISAAVEIDTQEAVVTFDPSRTTVTALTSATTNAGFLSVER